MASKIVRFRPHAIAFGLATLALAACTGSVVVFGDASATATSGQGGAIADVASSGEADAASSGQGGAGASGQGGTSSVAASSVAASSVAASSVAASSVAASSVAASSSSSGGGSTCSHDVCKQGEKLVPGCDGCVDQVCATDPYCCQTLWDAICTYRVAQSCNLACPGDAATPSCKDLYGSTVGFSLCDETATACEFAINMQQNSCATACAKAGGQCIAAFNDVNNQTCVKPQAPNLVPQSCGSTQYQTAICICSRGCGGGAPCPAGQTCKAGTCG